MSGGRGSDNELRIVRTLRLHLISPISTRYPARWLFLLSQKTYWSMSQPTTWSQRLSLRQVEVGMSQGRIMGWVPTRMKKNRIGVTLRCETMPRAMAWSQTREVMRRQY